MIRYTIDSTLTLKAVNVFDNQGKRETENYERKNNSDNGFKLTQRSKDKIRKYISGYFLEKDQTDSNVLWITLTVPPHRWGYDYTPEVEDRIVVKQLSKFLENLKKNHGLIDFIWVAERQSGERNKKKGIEKTATNSVHYHCVLDFEKYVPVQNLNLYWVGLMNEAGFKAFSHKTYLEKKDKLFDYQAVYERNSGLFNPYTFSTVMGIPQLRKKLDDVCYQEMNECVKALEHQEFRSALKGLNPMSLNPDHPLTKICYNPLDLERVSIKECKTKDGEKLSAFDRLSMYLTKYVTKNDSVIYSRCWGASRGFSSVNYEIELSENEADAIMNNEQIVKRKSESTFEIGENKYKTMYYNLDYYKVQRFDFFYRLMGQITTERLNVRNNGFDITGMEISKAGEKLLPSASEKIYCSESPLFGELLAVEQIEYLKKKLPKRVVSPRTNLEKIERINPLSFIEPNQGFQDEKEEKRKNETAKQLVLIEVEPKIIYSH